MQPMNYAIDVASPIEAAVSGLKFGAGLAELQQARQDRELKLKAQQQQLGLQQQLMALQAKPNRTWADYEPLVAFLPPEQQKAIRDNVVQMGVDKANAQKLFTGRVYAALDADPERGVQLLMDRADLEEKQGNLEDAKAYRTQAEIARVNPDAVKEEIVTVGGIAYDKDFANSLLQLQARKKAALMLKSDLREANAKADAAVSDARIKLVQADTEEARQAAELALKRAQADKARVEATFAERQQQADLEKKGADLGLTKQQTAQALAQTKNLGLEAQKIALEIAALGEGGDPKTRFDNEQKLRTEYQTRTKGYQGSELEFQRMKSSAQAKNGPGDIALITGFMKMLDPGSVVRETEFATARDTGGLFETLKGLASKLQTGAIFSLDSKQRDQFVTLAGQYLNAARKKAELERKDLGIVVKNYKLNPENVFGATEIPAPEAAPEAAPAAPPRGRDIGGGFRVVD